MIYPESLNANDPRNVPAPHRPRYYGSPDIDQREGKSDLNTYAGTFHIPLQGIDQEGKETIKAQYQQCVEHAKTDLQDSFLI